MVACYRCWIKNEKFSIYMRVYGMFVCVYAMEWNPIGIKKEQNLGSD